MKYLLKLEDRVTGREAFVECPANMSLEDLSVKIKLELQLPLEDHGDHCFLMQGKAYVPFGEYRHAQELYGWVCDYEFLGLPWQEVVQWIHLMPKMKDIRDSVTYRLKQVYTVLGSAICYDQASYHYGAHVRCTLLERLP